MIPWPYHTRADHPWGYYNNLWARIRWKWTRTRNSNNKRDMVENFFMQALPPPGMSTFSQVHLSTSVSAHYPPELTITSALYPRKEREYVWN